ncbi:(2Fe-2S) ferredoxin domain-containing protein [Cyclobacterium sp. 1_MG-2023]|nr:(2Fe-2S) ferredoxin domain-containing protein [Cyclobacterium sp. 1_MG-2023]MDO6438467.1 (2Fe-2S) ferredoxin domain-containing protein [Cyclobacterium sp. 1_MG-2023]
MKPRKKYIFICNGKDCKKNDNKSFSSSVKHAIDKAPLKGNFKLVKTKCLDCCKSGPVAVYNNHLVKKGDTDKLIQFLTSDLL